MITRLSKRALRLYDEKDLLKPEFKEITGYRYYHYEQIPMAIKLKNLSDLGFGLCEMKQMMEAIQTEDQGKFDDVVQQHIQNLDAELKRMEEVRGSLEDGSFMKVVNMEENTPEIKEVAAIRVVSKREIGSYDPTIGNLIMAVCSTVGRQQLSNPDLQFTGPPMSIYHDNEDKAGCDDADIEVCVPIKGQIEVDKDMEVKTLPAMKMISIIHKGPYNQVGEAYAVAFKWMKEKGYTVNGPCRELYLNDPKDVEEADILKEIQIPFK